jgi:hypothetical protein
MKQKHFQEQVVEHALLRPGLMTEGSWRSTGARTATLIRKNVETGEEQVLRSDETALPSAWTADGQTIVYNLATPEAGIPQIMMVLPLADLKQVPFAVPHATGAIILAGWALDSISAAGWRRTECICGAIPRPRQDHSGVAGRG